MTYSEFRARAFPEDKLALDPFLSRGYRYFSLPLSWILYRRSITPNQITYLQILLGLAGCLVIFLQPDTLGLFVGVLALHLAYVLDCVDGELARARVQQSISGVFLDKYAHAITMQAILVSTGVHMAHNMPEFYANVTICLSWIASFATFNPTGRLTQTVADAMIRKQQHAQYRMEHYAAKERVTRDETKTPGQKSRLKQFLKGDGTSSFKAMPVIHIAKHSFRHVSYLLAMTILLCMELLGIAQGVVTTLWCLACLAVITKECVHLYLTVNNGLIEDRIQGYQEIIANNQPGADNVDSDVDAVV